MKEAVPTVKGGGGSAKETVPTANGGGGTATALWVVVLLNSSPEDALYSQLKWNKKAEWRKL